MFTQVVRHLAALNLFVGKVWLPPPTVVKDKPALLMKFSADFLLMFVLVALKRLK